LTTILPERYMGEISSINHSADTSEHLQSCYRQIFLAAEHNVKVGVMRHLYDLYRRGPESIVLVYEDAFFRCDDLQYLPEHERAVLKDHFLARLDSDSDGALLN